MGKIESTLKAEITRLARKEVKAAMGAANDRIRDLTAKLRKVQTENAQLAKLVKKLQAARPAARISAESQKPATGRKPRLSPAMMKKFRTRNNLTQSHLAKLMGVSLGAITGWEKGSSTPRDKNREAFSRVRTMSKTELADALISMGVKAERPRRGRKPKAAKQ